MLVDAVLQNTTRSAPANNAEFEEAYEKWTEKSVPDRIPEESDKCKQKAWSLGITEKTQNNLLVRGTHIDTARVRAASAPESGQWLHAIPVPSLGTFLDAEQLRIGISLRIGAEICRSHKCRCDMTITPDGHHGLSCKYSSARIQRHNEINDVIQRALSRANVPSTLEQVGLCRDSQKRVDGLTRQPFKNGKYMCWDVTCVDTFSQSNVSQCAIDAGSAAKDAETHKRRKYAELAETYQFEPIAVETTGVYGPSTRKLISAIGSRIRAITDDPRETQWLHQRIGLAVQRGNALAIELGSKSVFC